ncbi:putative fatty-acid--CoA ligase [Gordonia effusa NBRC 100432]|uniref:Putative fatty-acid--CoA ligase n=1 Tax=Gordonia effusa NBRC 100432 TaxID=1077974 RepID=H0R411_9ACTN|nr:long-chain-acyl-CoA synthetase [Gordonia effusa]GAB19812.1 putative fatty-acid--CoA ligase [Gordonia effusa NBRC 100432]
MTAEVPAGNDIRIVDVLRSAVRSVPDAGVIARPVLRALASPRSLRDVGAFFERAASVHSHRPFLRFDGESVSYADANRRVNRYARVLSARGVRPGDTVAILGHNHPINVLAMLASVKVGACAGLVNYNARGDALDHALGLLRPSVILAGFGIDAGVLDGQSAEVIDFAQLEQLSADVDDFDPPRVDVDANDAALKVFTSGTTGMPKASKMSHRRWISAAFAFGSLLRLRPDDVLYCPLPLYHNNAMTASLAAAVGSGACLAIGERFSASRFWDEVIENDATAFTYIGETCRYLLAQPPKDTDRRHRVSKVMGNGLRPDIWDEFTERFGIERIGEFYTGSELPGGAFNFLGLRHTTGYSPPAFRAIVRYDEDRGLPVRSRDGRVIRVGRGEAGLLLIRNTSLSSFDGYTDDDATEAKLVRSAVRDGDSWVNTGDIVRDQGCGHIAFVDRIGDTFRWKGENVATTEVEGVLDQHPDIAEAVVFGVDIPGADGKAGMAAVVLSGETLDRDTLVESLQNSLPDYAIPLYIRVVDAIEHTSTFKSSKVALRELGYTVNGDPLYELTGKSPYRYSPYSGDTVTQVTSR